MIWQSMAGIAAFTCIAWLFSENRRRVNVKLVFAGIALQVEAAPRPAVHEQPAGQAIARGKGQLLQRLGRHAASGLQVQALSRAVQQVDERHVGVDGRQRLVENAPQG